MLLQLTAHRGFPPSVHILHTSGQNLSHLLPLHCVVTGGALAPDGARWIPAPPGFLFPVRALAQAVRGKYLDALRRAFHAGKLLVAGSTAPLADPAACAEGLRQLRQPDWVVSAKRPFAGPEQVLEYLGRYTHRVALSNERILSVADGPRPLPLEGTVHALMLRLTGIDIDRCPVCQQGRVPVTAILPSAPRLPRLAPSWDSS